MNCELCGKDTSLVKADIEGTILDVCTTCGAFGNIVKLQTPHLLRKRPTRLPKELQSTETVVSNFAQIIKSAREQKKLTQKIFAKKLNEKESVVHKIETGSLTPSIELARKLERILHIILIETIKESPLENKKEKSGAMTIGDIIKKK